MDRREWPTAATPPALESRAIHVWCVQLDELSDFALAPLSPQELEAASRPGIEHKRRRRAIARAVLRVLLGGYVGVDAASLRFELLPSGKPVLASPAAAGLDFSVSHSGDLALLAFARDAHVGVDVEVARRSLDAARLARRALAPDEAGRIERLGPEQGRREFLRAWTRREALVKLGEPRAADVQHGPGRVDVRVIELRLRRGASGALAVRGGSGALRCFAYASTEPARAPQPTRSGS
jgi:4'-phosphopantetheinyl transferase